MCDILCSDDGFKKNIAEDRTTNVQESSLPSPDSLLVSVSADDSLDGESALLLIGAGLRQLGPAGTS